ncbi:hypothetical protein DICPUDRAFT_29180 [Dictyostelium purpureum]|uniref:ABM domain-containing protein n=1 Tax=Dictyostelium purpureum TaxID=5786 RepID=F0ZD53_DICPU|nr:uncharacterized protein DICPUDRAFT_29180 [Dictyostelium purpureum]EGC38144.1 hypothetical protein DICPUDRAFT_29180 [Dictyostelium purpureum]|eukprot:XP_003285358.1 hypothetical protein DICPUDRAFT_29180 [Dictyostelium purpureum]
MSQINIIATVVIKSNFVEEFEKFAQNLVHNSRKEEGCISYTLNKDSEIPNKYYFVEEWKSMDAIEFHKNTTHFIEYINYSQDKNESLNITLMKPII